MRRTIAAAPLLNRPGTVSAPSLLVAGAISVATGWLLASPQSLRLAILVVAALAIVGIGSRIPRTLLLLMVVWLTALGFLRRVVTVGAGTTATDPLLLIGPLALGALLVVAARSEAFRRLTTLSKAVLVLNLLTLLGALNPVQGSVNAGLAGLIFVLMPVLAFWVGRALVDDRTLRRVLLLVAALAVPAAVYGLWQTFVGFPSWDRNWISSSGFGALNVDQTIRPFSVFSSAAEYGFFLAIGIAIWLSLSTRLSRVVPAGAAVFLLAAGLLYEASRTVAVVLVGALGIALAARRGVRPGAAIVVGAVAVVALSYGARHVGARGTPGTASALVAHQVQGLSNPFSSESSTALGHLSLVVSGVRSAFTNPAGSGVGAVTIAGSKFGGTNQNTEADPSNAAVALGLPGLLSYLVILVSGLATVYRLALRRRDSLAMAALTVVLAMTPEWLNGGQYAVAYLPWLVLGWADTELVGSHAKDVERRRER